MKKRPRVELESHLFPEFHARVRDLARKKRTKRKAKVRIVRVAPRHDLITFHSTLRDEQNSGTQFDPLASYAQISGPPQGIAGKWPKHKGGGTLLKDLLRGKK